MVCGVRTRVQRATTDANEQNLVALSAGASPLSYRLFRAIEQTALRGAVPNARRRQKAP